MLPPSSATYRSPEEEPVMLSTPVSGARAAGHQRVVVGQLVGAARQVELPDPVVALGGEPDGVVGVVAALAAVELLGAGDLGAGRGRASRPGRARSAR